MELEHRSSSFSLCVIPTWATRTSCGGSIAWWLTGAPVSGVRCVSGVSPCCLHLRFLVRLTPELRSCSAPRTLDSDLFLFSIFLSVSASPGRARARTPAACHTCCLPHLSPPWRIFERWKRAGNSGQKRPWTCWTQDRSSTRNRSVPHPELARDVTAGRFQVTQKLLRFGSFLSRKCRREKWFSVQTGLVLMVYIIVNSNY